MENGDTMNYEPTETIEVPSWLPLIHAVSIRDNAPGMNYQVNCSCGYRNNVASTNRAFVVQIAGEHLSAQLTSPDPFDNLICQSR